MTPSAPTSHRPGQTGVLHNIIRALITCRHFQFPVRMPRHMSTDTFLSSQFTSNYRRFQQGWGTHPQELNNADTVSTCMGEHTAQ